MVSPSDLNSSTTFPTFSQLPHEYEVNDTHFSSTKPRKHWCFLGQVVSRDVRVRLMLQVEDREGHKIVVAFHTDDRGAAFQALCTPGNTIAVLYATQHTFPFNPPGLSLEESGYIKLFPYTLEAMLKTSKMIFERNRSVKCEGCGRMDGSLRKCARCKTAWYCSRACQEKGWVAHKNDCAIFRDVQWFATRNWENGTNTYRFPAERLPWRALGYR